jgi:hypothetical protein
VLLFHDLFSPFREIPGHRSSFPAVGRGLPGGRGKKKTAFNPAIRIAAGHPFARGPGVEPLPFGTPQNRYHNDTHVGILQDDAPW